MKRNLKKYSVILILLVLTSNISFSVTFSYCSMGMKSVSCECEKENNQVSASFSKKFCCSTEIIDISNKADFENTQKNKDGIKDFRILNVINESAITDVSTSLTEYTDFSFHSPPSDIPVLISSLLI